MSPVTYRSLGASSLRVSSVGLGCMSLSGVYGAADDAQSVALVQHAIDSGINHLDTSDMYGWGHNEQVLSRALKGRRDKVVLASKFGQIQREGGQNGVDGSPAHVKAACEASLARLGVDVIDLYYQHRVDPAVPVEETIGAMARLVAEGKVRYLGICEAHPDRIARAHAVHPIAAVQTECSLLYRAEAEATRAITTKLGIGFVAYSPLGRGMLTGAIRDQSQIDGRRSAHPRFQPQNFGQNRALATALEEIAAAKHVTPSQLALAWVLARGDDVVTIPGTRSATRLDENAGAMAVALSAADLAAIEAAVPMGAAAGTRYPAGGMNGVFI